MIIKVSNPKRLKERLMQKKLVLYGMGTLGMKISKWLDEQNIDYIVADKNAVERQMLVEKRMVVPDALKEEYPDANVVVSSNLYYNEMKSFLLEKGFCEDQIISYAEFVPQNTVWTDLEDNIDWELMKPSVEVISKWVDKDIHSLADYGAGQMYLKKLISKDIEYFPVDYMKRFDETIVCDLNKGEFPKLRTDASVLNGILEFISTAEEFLAYICTLTGKKIMVSYMTIDKFPDEKARRASGYISDLTEKTIIKILGKGGFDLAKKTQDPIDTTDTIYLFEKK